MPRADFARSSLRGPAERERCDASARGCTRRGHRGARARRLTLSGPRAKPPAPGLPAARGGMAARLLPFRSRPTAGPFLAREPGAARAMAEVALSGCSWDGPAGLGQLLRIRVDGRCGGVYYIMSVQPMVEGRNKMSISRRFRAYSVVLVVGIVAVPAAVLSAGDLAAGLSKVTVQGHQVAGGKYSVALETQLSQPNLYDGVLVFAEPSHTLLLVQNNDPNGGVQLGENERPLVSVGGSLTESAPQVVVRYEASGDTRIVVQLASGAERTTVSDARINVAAFEFSTTFSSGDGNMPISYHHCPSCIPCGTMCVDCGGPRFTVDCVGCTIHCGW